MMQRKISPKNESYMQDIAAGKKFDNALVELFLSRVSAFINLTYVDGTINEQAKLYLLETMTITEEEYNFPLKMDFINSIEAFEDPVILAKRCDNGLNAIVYKLSYSKNDVKHTLHEIAFFSKIGNKYTFTHQYDLTQLFERFCKETISPMIRQIGDPILHKEAKNVGFYGEELAEINRQIAILKKNLTITGGVGIAANQCLELENPLKIILSGVDYNNPEHIVKALSRYPTVLFPQMKICINPEIKVSDQITEDFSEGCLSVHGIFRASVRRPRTLTVKYQDEKGNHHDDYLSGSDARVMLHELDHILNGKVYMQRIIDELTDEQRIQLIDIISKVLSNQESEVNSNQFLTPMVIFERNGAGQIIFDEKKVASNIKHSRRDVLENILHILDKKPLTTGIKPLETKYG